MMNYRTRKIAKDTDKVTGHANAPEVNRVVDPFHSGIEGCLRILKPLLDLSEVDALKYDWFIQYTRIERLLELERNNGILFSSGLKEIQKAVRIAKSIGKAKLTAADNDKSEGNRVATGESEPTDRGPLKLTPEQAKALEPAIAFYTEIEELFSRKQ